jgi:excisionase family DNA binding protein
MLSVTEVAERLKVSDQTVLRLIAAGELLAYRVGRAYRVAVEDLRAYLDRARVVTK